MRMTQKDEKQYDVSDKSYNMIHSLKNEKCGVEELIPDVFFCVFKRKISIFKGIILLNINNINADLTLVYHFDSTSSCARNSNEGGQRAMTI
jgi:hypothetical protein